MSQNAIEKNQGWIMPARKSASLKAGLYVVATPIGNLGDVTLRALDTLAAADIVVCEDTRVSGKLMAYFGLKKALVSYSDHSTKAQRSGLIKKIEDGQSLVLISDAGMPLISDPGYKLIRECLDAQLYVTSLPGANAPLAALQLSGLPSDQFCFLGFLPTKTQARKKVLAQWRGAQASLICFESAPRLIKALRDIHEVLGDRDVAVVREITKLYEESRRGNVGDLIQHYDAQGLPKGEIVLVIEAALAEVVSQEDIERDLRAALENHSVKDAAALIANQTGRRRREIYALALTLDD